MKVKRTTQLSRRNPFRKRQRKDVWERDRKPAFVIYCHWCQRPLLFHHMTLDHVVRLCDGGKNDISNIVASCGICNSERHNPHNVPRTQDENSKNYFTIHNQDRRASQYPKTIEATDAQASSPPNVLVSEQEPETSTKPSLVA